MPPKAFANGDVNAVESEQVKLMEKEIREQEKLLSGYQQENERIYQVGLHTINDTTT